MSFTNKVVIVTGGSAGIGAATVVQFAREGAKVVIVGRNEDKLRTVAEQCQSLNTEYLIVKADVANENDAKKIIDDTINKFGQLDVLINNAGILREGSILDEGILKTYDEIMNTNVKSIVVLTSLAAPFLIETKGNIINISSIGGSMVRSPFTTYCVSKAAVNIFTVGAASELAPHGVRVNTVSPGPVRTDLVRSGRINIDIEDWKELTALGRISAPTKYKYMLLSHFIFKDNSRIILLIIEVLCKNNLA